MLTNKELEDIRVILSESNNTFYLFDDDGDGVCSYLILKKHYKNGIGMPIKSAGPLDETSVDQLIQLLKSKRGLFCISHK